MGLPVVHRGPYKWNRQAWQSVRETSEDATLLALKIGWKPWAKECRQHIRQGSRSSENLQEEFSHTNLILTQWDLSRLLTFTELWDNKFVLLKPLFIVICYNSNRKQCTLTLKEDTNKNPKENNSRSLSSAQIETMRKRKMFLGIMTI